MTRIQKLLKGLQVFVLVFVVLPASIAGAESNKNTSFVVIVNQANPTQSISRAELSRFFLKQMTQWDNGTSIVPIDLLRESPARASFSDGVHRRSVSAISSYWQNMIFSGRSVPPVELASEQDAVAFVKGQPGAVAYVSKGTNVSGVNIIEVR